MRSRASLGRLQLRVGSHDRGRVVRDLAVMLAAGGSRRRDAADPRAFARHIVGDQPADRHAGQRSDPTLGDSCSTMSDALSPCESAGRHAPASRLAGRRLDARRLGVASSVPGPGSACPRTRRAGRRPPPLGFGLIAARGDSIPMGGWRTLVGLPHPCGPEPPRWPRKTRTDSDL